MIRYVVEDEAGERLDRHLARATGEPRNQVQRWIADRRVTVNGKPAKASYVLRLADAIEAEPPETPPDAEIEPEPGTIDVVYEDADLVVLDKPAGLAVHPGAGREAGTLAHRLLHRYPEMAGVGGPGRPGIVHRLDLGTTGILVAARSQRAYRRLAEAFANRTVEKSYLAIVYGTPRAASGRLEAPIGRDPKDRKKMAVRDNGRPAVTQYLCSRSAGGISWLEIGLETGRTHQIRVHLKAMGHPLIGDPVYGEARWRGLEPRCRRPAREFPRPALHAWRLSFLHPVTAERVELEAPVPEDMARLWRRLTGEEPPTGARPESCTDDPAMSPPGRR